MLAYAVYNIYIYTCMHAYYTHLVSQQRCYKVIIKGTQHLLLLTYIIKYLLLLIYIDILSFFQNIAYVLYLLLTLTHNNILLNNNYCDPLIPFYLVRTLFLPALSLSIYYLLAQCLLYFRFIIFP
jgi:hypothetical protein